jgi:hypothetical protein
MNNLLRQTVFGRDNRVSGLVAFSIVMLIVLGCTCGKDFDLGKLSSNSNSSNSNGSVFGDDDKSSDDDSTDVDSTLTKATIRSTTADFASAISTEDFSGLYNETATEFRSQYTEAQLKNEFSDFIAQKSRILPILATAIAMDPEYTDGPSTKSVGSETVMSVSGKYPTRPLPVSFKYEYVKREGRWWLLRLEIYIRK